MKELSIEEKTRNYDKAREKIAIRFGSNVADEIFSQFEMSEDERMRNAAINACKYMVDNFENSTKQYEDAIAWLEKQSEQKYAWSEEDETALGDALWCCKQAASIAKDENDMGNVWYAETWLKSIKNRVQPQPKQEWSEQEQVRINRIVAYLENLNVADNDILLKDVDWLKSLRPHNTWKPSELQIEALEWQVNNTSEDNWQYEESKNLLKQIKKLREG